MYAAPADIHGRELRTSATSPTAPADRIQRRFARFRTWFRNSPPQKVRRRRATAARSIPSSARKRSLATLRECRKNSPPPAERIRGGGEVRNRALLGSWTEPDRGLSIPTNHGLVRLPRRVQAPASTSASRRVCAAGADGHRPLQGIIPRVELEPGRIRESRKASWA